eukprot:4583175-Pleurochrysis_carterae.AAC.1
MRGPCACTNLTSARLKEPKRTVLGLFVPERFLSRGVPFRRFLSNAVDSSIEMTLVAKTLRDFAHQTRGTLTLYYVNKTSFP